MAGGYVLWGGGPSRSMMVEMVLAEAGASYELREVNVLEGEHRAPAFLAVNPYGWAPALTTPEGETIVETPAINLCLCERHGLDLAPSPGHPDRAAFLSAWLNVTGEIEPTLKRVFFAHRYAAGAEDVPRTRALAWEMLADRLAPIDRRLADAAGPFFLGERFSLADLTLAYWMPYAERQGVLAGFPSVAAALDAARVRPALAPVFARQAEWIDRLAHRLRDGA